MGEAKRRKMRGDYPDTTKPKVSEQLLQYPQRWLTDDLGCEPVCTVLSNLIMGSLSQRHGDCVFRHYFAWRALQDIGVETDWVYGSMIAKVGKGSLDTVVFGTEDQFVVETPNGWLGHTWLKAADGSLIDFTVGRWQEITAEAVDGLPPIRWQMMLPEHFWFVPEDTGFIQSVANDAPRNMPKFGEIIYREHGHGIHLPIMKGDSGVELEASYQLAKPQIMDAFSQAQASWRGRHNRSQFFSQIIGKSLPEGYKNFYSRG